MTPEKQQKTPNRNKVSQCIFLAGVPSPGLKHSFFREFGLVLIVAAFVFMVMSGRAEILTHYFTGTTGEGTGYTTVTVNTETRAVTHSGYLGNWAGYKAITWEYVLPTPSGRSHLTPTGFVYAEGTTSIKVIMGVVTGSGSTTFSTTFDEYTFDVAEAPPTYGITVNLPANTTTTPKNYVARQLISGEWVQLERAFQGPGAAAREWYIGGLASSADVQVVEITGGNVLVTEEGEFAMSSETEYSVVSPQTAPTEEPSPGSGATAETDVTGGNSQGLPSSPNTEAPEAPTPTSNPDAPTATTGGTKGTGPTPFEPSGTGGATKEDLENATNKELEGLDALADTVKSTGDATTSAVDKVATAVWESGKKATEATDKVATAIWESSTKEIEAANKQLAATDKVRSELSGKMSQMIEKQNATIGAINTTNSKLDTITEKVNLLLPMDSTAANSSATGAVTNQGTNADTLSDTIVAALPSGITTPSVPAAGAFSSSSSIMSVSTPLGTLEFSIPSSLSGFLDAAPYFREFVLFLLGIAFCYAQQRSFEEYFQTFWKVSEKTTKVEPTQVVPGVGWAKQLGTTLLITSVFTGVVALAITLINSNVTSLIGTGTTVQSALVNLRSLSDGSLGYFSQSYAIMDKFLPVSAAFQFVSAYYVIGWARPPLWAGAYSAAKYIHA